MNVTKAAPATASLTTALRLDAALVAMAGLALIIAASPLGRLLALDTGFLRTAGLLLLPWAAFVGWSGMRVPPSRIAAWTVVTGNTLWVLASLTALILRAIDPNVLGITFVLAQALVVAALAGWQAVTMRGAAR